MCICIYKYTYPVYISTGVSDGFLKHQLGTVPFKKDPKSCYSLLFSVYAEASSNWNFV